MLPKRIVIRSTNVSGLHSSALFGAKYAVHHQPSAKTENLAIVANPVLVRELFNTVATLVNRDVAKAAENDHVFVFIVSTITYYALCVLLSTMLPRVSCVGL